MAIVKLKKITVFGEVSEKKTALRALQNFGELHIIDLEGAAENNVPSDSLSEALQISLRYLEASPLKRKQAPFSEDLKIEELIAKVRDNQQRKRDYSDKYDLLRQREEALKPWGNFHLAPLDSLGGIRLWFYILPHKHLQCLETLDYPWEIVHQNHSRAWLVLLSPEEPPLDVLPVDRFHTGTMSLAEIKNQVVQVELALEDIEAERQSLTRYINVMKRLRARAIDQTHLGQALSSSVDLEKFFVVQAWVAEHRLTKLRALAKQPHLLIHEEAITADDAPPTLLENPAALKGGEMLVNFYQTPAYTAWDPSLILFFSFSLFFAMILSDAAYASILLAGLLASWGKLGKTPVGRKLRPLFMSIGFTSLVWGMLVGSYFGISPGEESPLQAIHILDVNDFDSMMALSIACGLLHILLANIQQVYRYWGSSKALLHSGWVCILLAGAMLGFSYKSYPNFMIYVYALGTLGLSMVFVGGGQRKIKRPQDWLIRLLEGLRSVTGITNIFGDVLSYLRLFALGLASASLALTFNNLASNAFASGGLGVLFGLLILLIGHTLNLFLAIVSGVVHGLRLNFIEFYNWALDGEGYPFKAFKKREYSQ